VAVAVVLVTAVGFAVGRTSIGTNPGLTGNGATGTSAPSGNAATIAAKVDPGVVDVVSQLAGGAGEAAGTGMVLNATGEILTNNHVVDGATSVSVTDVGNGQTYGATVVGTDATDDVAVLRLQSASGLDTVTLGNSSTLSVGQSLTAIGNAGGVGGTPSVASGTVTALGQSITASDESDGSSEQLAGLIQTDAALQPGDSGGPLVDSGGRVVGMDTAASSGFEFQSGSSQGYSIPINRAVSIARQIMAGRSSDTIHIGPAALIGVEVQPEQGVSGAPVVAVEPASPADGAGIVDGDVIVSVNGQSVGSTTALRSLMVRYHPGDTVTVGWVDQSGASHSASLQLVTGPAT
jgi:S1-C subfamily serine protease